MHFGFIHKWRFFAFQLCGRTLGKALYIVCACKKAKSIKACFRDFGGRLWEPNSHQTFGDELEEKLASRPVLRSNVSVTWMNSLKDSCLHTPKSWKSFPSASQIWQCIGWWEWSGVPLLLPIQRFCFFPWIHLSSCVSIHTSAPNHIVNICNSIVLW